MCVCVSVRYVSEAPLLHTLCMASYGLHFANSLPCCHVMAFSGSFSGLTALNKA